nr:putative receptor-like protein kinase At4g00960 [Ipomoea batatas]
MISGQKNSTFNHDPGSQNLLEWAYKLYKKGRCLEIMDPMLTQSAIPDEVAMCIQIGLLCTQSDPQLRPTMRRVVVMLSKKPGTLDEEPTRPGFPGSRYRRSHRPTATSSSAGTSGASGSGSFGSSTTGSVTASASTTSRTIPKIDRGKRPIQE